MPDQDPIIKLLSVPGIHSGTELGGQLGMSRVAIKKRIDKLIANGFPLETLAGKGYRLKAGIELLDESKIASQVDFERSNHRLKLEVFDSLHSTNIYLSSKRFDVGEVQVVLAESQLDGQGRRGRSWVSPPFQNLALSIGYSYSSWPNNPSALSLAFSVAVHRALVNMGVHDLKLKWPNDLYIEDKKLGGLLVSASGETGGEFSLVLGVGINVLVGKDELSKINQPAIDLDEAGYKDISRNQLAAEIISNTAEMLAIYPEVGFAPFAEYWNQHSKYVGQKVRLSDGEQEHLGILQGVNEAGELCIAEKDGRVNRFNKSELSLRSVD